MRRREQQDAPEGKIEPAKILGVALVLHVVEYGNGGAAAEHRRCEPRIQQRVQPVSGHRDRQCNLFPQDARGPRLSDLGAAAAGMLLAVLLGGLGKLLGLTITRLRFERCCREVIRTINKP